MDVTPEVLQPACHPPSSAYFLSCDSKNFRMNLVLRIMATCYLHPQVSVWINWQPFWVVCSSGKHETAMFIHLFEHKIITIKSRQASDSQQVLPSIISFEDMQNPHHYFISEVMETNHKLLPLSLHTCCTLYSFKISCRKCFPFYSNIFNTTASAQSEKLLIKLVFRCYIVSICGIVAMTCLYLWNLLCIFSSSNSILSHAVRIKLLSSSRVHCLHMFRFIFGKSELIKQDHCLCYLIYHDTAQNFCYQRTTYNFMFPPGKACLPNPLRSSKVDYFELRALTFQQHTLKHLGCCINKLSFAIQPDL